MQAHGFTDVQGANEIALVGTHRVVHRGLHRSHRSQVHHRTATRHQPRDQRGIGHIAFDKVQTRISQRQVVALAHRQVVQHPHRMTLRQ
ncbi:hypothetical protein D9M68_831890 [compost metagenome]